MSFGMPFEPSNCNLLFVFVENNEEKKLMLLIPHKPDDGGFTLETERL